MALVRIFKKHGGKLTMFALLVGGTAYIFGSAAKYVGYKPDQPIPFSHKIHAGELQIDCQFCHTTVEKSSRASIPDTATCMKCHQVVAPDSKHIQFLKESYKQGVPIRWTKVYDLPDHARFSHRAHITKGLDCSVCHGDVASMTKMEVYPPFTMGWCVNCHREYTAKLRNDPRLRIQDREPGNNVAVKLTECGTCHY